MEKIEIKLTRISHIFGDETALYSVELSRECTLREFIDRVLEFKREWGYIRTNQGDNIEYRYGEIVDKRINQESLSRKILKIQGHGGWSRMDYSIII